MRRAERSGLSTQAWGRELIQKKTSDFPVSGHKYFDKELGIYQKKKKKKRKSRRRLPKDPTLSEFHDLIPCKVVVVRHPLLSERRGIWTFVLLIAHTMPLSKVRSKAPGIWGDILATMFENIFLNHFRFLFSILSLYLLLIIEVKPTFHDSVDII